MGAITDFFTGGSAPKASTASTKRVEEEKRKARRARPALIQTEGGFAGQELQAGQVGRGTVFGN